MSEKHRPIRSFVLRQGRFTQAQRHAIESLWPRFGLEEGMPLDFDGIFGNSNPVYLEIGFGNGDALLDMAARHPERNYLGIEVHKPGVGSLLSRLEDRTNIRVMNSDAMEIMKQQIPDASLAGVYLFFPDPWHKKRHNKRRIVNPAFLDQVTRALKPDGFIHLATDWQDYAEHMAEHLLADQRLRNTSENGPYVSRPEDRTLTRFEQRGHRLGHNVWDLIFKKV